MKTLTTLAIAIMLALSFSFAFAADSPKVSLNAQDMTLDQTAAELSKQAGIPVICDSAVRGTVSGSFSDIELDKLLDIITKPQNLKWQKVYLPDQKDKKLTFEQIKAQAEAVAAIADMPMAVYDPTTGKQTVFIKQAADAPAVSPEKLGLKPVYLITKPKAVEVAKKEENNSDDPVSAFQQQNTRAVGICHITLIITAVYDFSAIRRKRYISFYNRLSVSFYEGIYADMVFVGQ
jgi:hypothetical protein